MKEKILLMMFLAQGAIFQAQAVDQKQMKKYNNNNTVEELKNSFKNSITFVEICRNDIKKSKLYIDRLKHVAKSYGDKNTNFVEFLDKVKDVSTELEILLKKKCDGNTVYYCFASALQDYINRANKNVDFFKKNDVNKMEERVFLKILENQLNICSDLDLVIEEYFKPTPIDTYRNDSSDKKTISLLFEYFMLAKGQTIDEEKLSSRTIRELLHLVEDVFNVELFQKYMKDYRIPEKHFFDIIEKKGDSECFQNICSAITSYEESLKKSRIKKSEQEQQSQ